MTHILTMPTLERSVGRQHDSLPTVAVGDGRYGGVVAGMHRGMLILKAWIYLNRAPSHRLRHPSTLPQLHPQAQNALLGN